MATSAEKSTTYLSQSSSEKLYGSLDPLGEIKNRAQEIWIEQGRPESKSWKDFTPNAEQQLLCERNGIPSKKHLVTKTIDMPIPSAIKRLRLDQTPPLLRALSLTTSTLLEQHEAYCLTRLLGQSSFRLSNPDIALYPNEKDIAIVLANLVGEYPKDESGNVPSIAGKDVPLESKVAYWQSQIRQWLVEDTPLNFADRNTMQRFHIGVLDSGIVTEIMSRA